MKKELASGHLQVKGGKYYVVLYLPQPNGKKKAKWISTHLDERGNKTRAEEMLRELRQKYARGELLPQGRQVAGQEGLQPLSPDMLFSDYLFRWVESTRLKVDLNTYGEYRKVIHNRVAPYFQENGMLLSSMSAFDLQDFYAWYMSERKVKAATIRRMHANIRKALKDAVKLKLIASNVAADVELPRSENFVANYYNGEELRELLNKVQGSEIEFPVMIAAFYGLRRSEIVGLKWSAIDFEEKIITVSHTVLEAHIDGRHVLVKQDRTKTKSSFRSLPLVPEIEQMLRRKREQQRIQQRLCGAEYAEEGKEYIFVDAMGNLLKPEFITRHFSALLKKEGMKKIRFHDLRHSCASLLLKNGIGMKEIQLWLGHSNFNTTANTYSHLDYSSKLHSAMTMEKCLNYTRAANE